jgi:hypothetical protein
MSGRSFKRSDGGRWGVRFVGLIVSAVCVLVMVPGAAYATQANPSTNDQSTTINTGWWAYGNVTATQLGSFLSTNGARLTTLRVDNPSTPTFDATMVANSGPYASGWWWYYGLTASQVATTLSTNNARLISLEPYVVGGNLYFAVVEVPNTGAQARGWWWYYGLNASSIASTLASNGARLVSLRPYTTTGGTAWAAIEISNSGVDYADAGSWWSLGQTPAQISAQLSSDSARLISLAADPTTPGTFDAVYLGSEGEGWSWWYGLNVNTLVQNELNYGDRLIDITSYSSGGQTVWAGVGLDDSNPLQAPINAKTTATENYAAANGWGGGLDGLYYASITNPNSPNEAFNSGYRYEPASAIKVLYLTYALYQVQLGNDSLSNGFTYYKDPADPTNSGVCPQTSWEVPANAVTTTLGAALQLMMYNSDNRVTRAMEERYGIANVNSFAHILGMSHSSLAQPFIGCGFQGAVRNELTPYDVSGLYSKIAGGKVLNAAMTKQFFADELGGTPSSTDYLTTVINQEAAKLGKSAIASQFVSLTQNHWKAGSYSFCMASACSAYKADFSIAGVMSFPAKSTLGTVTPKKYAYADFVNDLYVPCVPGSGCTAENNAYAMIGQVTDEAARPAIDAALKNW